MKTSDHIAQILKVLPHKPGVYQYYDVEGRLIYVGKAKSLKKRVQSYFTKQKHESAKTKILVRNIADIKYIVVDNEYDALLLENSLIKENQPKYNVNLKDDKTYPSICIKNERFPRIFSTRRIIKDGSEYFGPYPSAKVQHSLLDTIKKIYPLRTCNYDLSEQNIKAGKYKACLEYQIGNCKAPCIGKQSLADYNAAIQHIKEIIKGNAKPVIKSLKEQMVAHAEAMEFEDAQNIKERIDLMEKYQSKSTIVNPKLKNIDVFTIDVDGKDAVVNYMLINNGTIVYSVTFDVARKLEEPIEEILPNIIMEVRDRYKSTSREVITSVDLDIEIPDVQLHFPQRGDKKSLVDLSLKNIKYYILDKRKKATLIDPERHSMRILETIKSDLRLKELPRHIECFDNSNHQGTDAVAACVVFKNAKPAKRDYRHFNIKTVVGPDDFASMEEVVYRRYKRLKEAGEPLPQLIIVDGGKGQLSSGVKSLKRLDLYGQIAIVGIAKRLEEIYFPGDSLPLYIDKKSESLKVIQHLRNEAHRFGITHHRKKKTKRMTNNQLTLIEGIGDVTAKELLTKFKSVKRIKEATEQDIAEVVGADKAKKIKAYFLKA